MYHDAAALCPARIEARTAEQQLWNQRLSDVTRESSGGMEEHQVSAARTPFRPAAGCCQSVPCCLLAAYGSVRQCGRVRQRGGLMGVMVVAADGGRRRAILGRHPKSCCGARSLRRRTSDHFTDGPRPVCRREVAHYTQQRAAGVLMWVQRAASAWFACKVVQTAVQAYCAGPYSTSTCTARK